MNSRIVLLYTVMLVGWSACAGAQYVDSSNSVQNGAGIGDNVGMMAVGAGSGRMDADVEVRIGEEKDGVLPLEFVKATKKMFLVVAGGSQDGGAELGGWHYAECIRNSAGEPIVFSAGMPNFDYRLPSGWGRALRHLRFFLYAADEKDAAINAIDVSRLMQIVPCGKSETFSFAGTVPWNGPWAGKAVSVLGDSYSTFAGTAGTENPYYPRSSHGVLEERHQWWAQVIERNGGTLLANRSCGASEIGVDNGAYRSFINRVDESFGRPDVVLVLGGLNDYWHHPDSLTTEAFREYVSTLFTRIRTRFPLADVYVGVVRRGAASSINTGVAEFVRQVLFEQASSYGCCAVDLDAAYTAAQIPDGHPDAEAMKGIAEAFNAAIETETLRQAFAPPEAAYDVTLESLLDEMCDPEANARLPEHPWKGRLWSSYDRRSVSPCEPKTWVANDDWSNFVRTETRNGHVECVLVDEQGAGALTRFRTTNDRATNTVYRIYVDGAESPVIVGVGTELIGGHGLCGAPLADEVSPFAQRTQRAQNLYLPVPFAKSLVVTAELKSDPPLGSNACKFWYNAEVRKYASGTSVEPLTSSVLMRAAHKIAEVNMTLGGASAANGEQKEFGSFSVAAGACVTKTLVGEGAIREIRLKVPVGEEGTNALRKVRVKFAFDGEETVDVAIGQLFGAGPVTREYETTASGATSDGVLVCRYAMPYATEASIAFVNAGSSPVEIGDLTLSVAATPWDAERSMHFGGLGLNFAGLSTRSGEAGYYDLPWVTLVGQGVVVGNVLLVDNGKSSDWWGQGDEKIYVDGEAFPSYFGTGTDDFFGYAWGSRELIASHPFIAVLRPKEQLANGHQYTTSLRTRRLDAVPFRTSLRLDVEVWHLRNCTIDYAPATFWYARPGVKVTQAGSYDVTLESLLEEMCDAEANTRLPAHPWKGRLWSSHDRRSVLPDNRKTWVANDDWSNFVRTEVRDGRVESVLVDERGAGALTRFWTANQYATNTVYRFYVDDATTPVIAGVGTELIGGHGLCGAPLADEVSPYEQKAKRAQNLYLPVPFAKSLVVTAELKADPPLDSSAGKFWYNAEVRKYATGTTVEPLTVAVLAREADKIAKANAELGKPSTVMGEQKEFGSFSVAAGDSVSKSLAGEGMIRELRLTVPVGMEGVNVLRKMRMKLAFDGEDTADVVLGQLFGIGPMVREYNTVASGSLADGRLVCRYAMPYAKGATITFANASSGPIEIGDFTVTVAATSWSEERSMHFGGLGLDLVGLPTRQGEAGYYDLPWVTLFGQGMLVGNVLFVDNGKLSDWWGEGDEKIYVDGEVFPSYFGTGTEDFFGYAWGPGKPTLSHPFVAVPYSGDGLVSGHQYATAVRTRRLDAVPFTTSLRLDVEVWHWRDCLIDYAPATFWYARPGVKVTQTGGYDVTIETLLDELCDAEANMRLPEHPWKGRHWSSYDRRSVLPDNRKTWVANDDWSNFVRTEIRDGRTESVLVEEHGAGALTRFWTANQYATNTVYRFYVDDATAPVIAGIGTELIGGHGLCGAPLADEVSPYEQKAKRAQNLYLPVPFAKSLVVTAELRPNSLSDKGDVLFYYNAEVRKYTSGTTVEPLTAVVLARAANRIDAANATLGSAFAASGEQRSFGSFQVAEGAVVTKTLWGEGAIRELRLRVPVDLTGTDVLRKVRVKLAFDEEETVDVSLGQLFGAWHVAREYDTVASGATSDGELVCRYVMPYARKASITFANVGGVPAEIGNLTVTVAASSWDTERSMHFGGLGFDLVGLPTRLGVAGYYDLPWVTLVGQGALVGNVLFVDNGKVSDWWGEGDEKIYVDGEPFPSYFGTGTEDFFGYAWCSPALIMAHPFIAVLRPKDQFLGGHLYATSIRTRRLDAVPFTESLRLDVEVWHWRDCQIDYAPATFWYARPGVKVSRKGVWPVSTEEVEKGKSGDIITIPSGATVDVSNPKKLVVNGMECATKDHYVFQSTDAGVRLEIAPEEAVISDFTIGEDGLVTITPAKTYGEFFYALEYADVLPFAGASKRTEFKKLDAAEPLSIQSSGTPLQFYRLVVSDTVK